MRYIRTFKNCRQKRVSCQCFFDGINQNQLLDIFRKKLEYAVEPYTCTVDIRLGVGCSPLPSP